MRQSKISSINAAADHLQQDGAPHVSFEKFTDFFNQAGRLKIITIRKIMGTNFSLFENIINRFHFWWTYLRYSFATVDSVYLWNQISVEMTTEN